MLADKDENGEYKIPFLVVCDTFSSETVAFADLVLPDTTYLERHDVLSMLDRPISEFDGPVDAVRLPVLPPKGDCRPFQDVLIELGARSAAGLHQGGRQRQVPQLPGLRRQLRDLARLRHRLPGRLARQVRREVHQGRAEPAPVGAVRRQQLRLPPRAAAQLPVHAQLEQGLSALGARPRHDPLGRADHAAPLLRGAATLPRRGPGQAARPPAAGAAAQAHRDLLRPAAVLLRAAGGS
jgi:hypothetical protein